MTTETAEAEVAAGEPGTAGPVYHGYVILEWPRHRQAAPGYAHVLPGWKITPIDAISGDVITTVSKVEIAAEADGLVVARMTMFADEDGGPIRHGKPCIRDSEILTGTFSFFVSEMRIRQQ